MANTLGEKELKKDWDYLTSTDSTKSVGHVQNLVSEEKSLIYKNQKAGIN